MATKLLKKNNDRLLTLKAYNGRCALLWLEDRVRAAASIQDYVDRDPQLILCSDAMSLECVYYKCYCCACMCLVCASKSAMHIVHMGIVIQVLLASDLTQPRTSMARVIHHIESSPRFLQHVCMMRSYCFCVFNCCLHVGVLGFYQILA